MPSCGTSKPEEIMTCIVRVDVHSCIEVKLSGNTTLDMPLLGALEMARSVLVKRIDERLNFSGTYVHPVPPPVVQPPLPSLENQSGQEESSQHNGDNTVSRDKALDYYLDLRNKIDARIGAIGASDPRMEFQLPKNIL